jgi:DNA-binding transcriptional regulator LsrR (DeoR family)
MLAPSDADAGPGLLHRRARPAVSDGVSKSAAVRAAISAGMVHGLITHASLAREPLKLAQS